MNTNIYSKNIEISTGIPGSSYLEWGMRWEGIENWEGYNRSFYSVYIVFLKLFDGLMVSLIIYSTTFC